MHPLCQSCACACGVRSPDLTSPGCASRSTTSRVSPPLAHHPLHLPTSEVSVRSAGRGHHFAAKPKEEEAFLRRRQEEEEEEEARHSLTFSTRASRKASGQSVFAVFAEDDTIFLELLSESQRWRQCERPASGVIFYGLEVGRLRVALRGSCLGSASHRGSSHTCCTD